MTNTVSSLTEQFLHVSREIQAQYEQRRGDLSQADKHVSAIYHEIEFNRFDVVRGFRLAQRLKEVLTARREVKRDLEVLYFLSQKLGHLADKTEKKLNQGQAS